jgi:hypothetical protein
MQVGRKLAATVALGLVLSGLLAAPASARRDRTGDADRDHVADSWELASGLDRTDRSDRKADFDGDKLRDEKEFRFGSDPLDEDSDDDGIDHGDEQKRAHRPAGTRCQRQRGAGRRRRPRPRGRRQRGRGRPQGAVRRLGGRRPGRRRTGRRGRGRRPRGQVLARRRGRRRQRRRCGASRARLVVAGENAYGVAVSGTARLRRSHQVPTRRPKPRASAPPAASSQ